jgi:hypothetical protein
MVVLKFRALYRTMFAFRVSCLAFFWSAKQDCPPRPGQWGKNGGKSRPKMETVNVVSGEVKFGDGWPLAPSSFSLSPTFPLSNSYPRLANFGACRFASNICRHFFQFSKFSPPSKSMTAAAFGILSVATVLCIIPSSAETRNDVDRRLITGTYGGTYMGCPKISFNRNTRSA